MDEIRYLPLSTFVDEGYLQEVNRQFFHPLGLQLCADTDFESGNVTGFQIMDCRDEVNSVWYMFEADEFEHRRKYLNVAKEWKTRSDRREAELGYMVEPVPSEWTEEIESGGVIDYSTLEGLNGFDINIIRHLEKYGRASTTTLAEAYIPSDTAFIQMTILLNNLQANGLITEDGDGWILTPKGGEVAGLLGKPRF
jgi:hypothetical protein